MVFILMVYSFSTSGQESIKTQYFEFQINYWFNMHQFLWAEAFVQAYKDGSLVSKELDRESNRELKQALDYYKNNLVDLDPRTDNYMTRFKHWITSQEKAIDTVPKEFRKHFEILAAFSEVYSTVFWKEHQMSCQSVLQDNFKWIEKTEIQFVKEITLLTRQFWQQELLKVDLTYYGKFSKRNTRNLPYTTLFPTHVVMNVDGQNEVQGNWLELLYHEAAHHLILGSSYFVGGTINDVSKAMNVEIPRQLGHSYLFYFTGELTKELLENLEINDYTTYMERNNLFSNYYPILTKHLKNYMEGNATLAKTTESVINDLQEN